MASNSDTFAETESSKENCSLVMPPYAELLNKTTGQVYSLRKDLEYIGRSYTALISLKDIEVSRKHCTFSKLSENLCGFTSVGRNCTILNGVVCPPNAQIVLSTGDEMKITSNEFIFKYTKDSLATGMEESAKEDTNNSIEERRNLFDRSQCLEKEKFNNWFRNLQEKNSDEIRNFEKIISKCSSNNNMKPEEADKEKDALRNEMKRMVDEFEKQKEEWLKQEKLLEDRLLQQKKEFEEKEDTTKSIEVRRNLFDRIQCLEKEKFNNLFRNLQEKISEEIRNFEKIISKCSSNNNVKPEEADKEKDALRNEMKRMVDEFEKQKEEWLKQEKLLEDRLLQQKKEFEEKLELEIQATTVNHDVKLKGLKQTADYFKNEYEKTKTKLDKECFRLKAGIQATTEHHNVKLMGLKRTAYHLNNKYERTKSKLIKECDEVREQLKNKELDFKKEARSMFDCMGRDLECGICTELCVEPMMLNCGHVFCKFCISTWKKKKKECPICQTKIKNEIRNWSYDSIIEKMLKFLPEEDRKQRERVFSERKALSSNKSSSSLRPKEPAASTSVIRHASTQPPNSTQRNSFVYPAEFQEGTDLFLWVEPVHLHMVPQEHLFSPTVTRSRSNPNDSVVILDDEAIPSTVDLTHISSEPVDLVHMPREVAVDLSNRPNQLTVEEIDLTSPIARVTTLPR